MFFCCFWWMSLISCLFWSMESLNCLEQLASFKISQGSKNGNKQQLAITLFFKKNFVNALFENTTLPFAVNLYLFLYSMDFNIYLFGGKLSFIAFKLLMRLLTFSSFIFMLSFIWWLFKGCPIWYPISLLLSNQSLATKLEKMNIPYFIIFSSLLFW